MKKVNLYRLTDNITWYSDSVYHDKGFKVVSNEYFLIALKEEYSHEIEGKMVNKKGIMRIENYPNWRIIVPSESDRTFVPLDLCALEELCKGYKARRAAIVDKIAKKSYFERLCIGGTFFSLAIFCKLLPTLKALGIKEIGVKPSPPAEYVAIMKSEEGSIILTITLNPGLNGDYLTHKL